MDKTQNAIEIFNRRAADYQAKFMDFDLYNDTLDLFCSYIKTENAAILDVACGPGNITKYLLKKRPDFKIHGIDLAPNMIELARINNPTAAFQIMDFREITSPGKKPDGIICGFGLPYLSKEEAIKWIQDASKILHPNGILYLSTMEDDYSKSGLKKSTSGSGEIFIHYHQADYLTETLTHNGFKILDIRRKDFPEPDGSKTVDLVIIAGK